MQEEGERDSGRPHPPPPGPGPPAAPPAGPKHPPAGGPECLGGGDAIGVVVETPYL